MLEPIASGRWLTAERRRAYAWISIAFTVLMLGWIVFNAHGIVASDGKPVGTDFSNVYAAGRMSLRGEAASAYDWNLEHTEEQAISGSKDIPFYGWHYPPFFLLLAAALATMPYLAALAVWQLSTFWLYLKIAHSLIPKRETILLAAAAPAVFVNFGHGHNGFLTASLLSGALMLLDRRPKTAGMLIGLLAYKPQFGILIPLLLLVTRRWQVFAAATATVAAMAALVTLIFGVHVWTAFYGSLGLTETIILDAGSTGWEKIQSIFSAVRMWGGSVALAQAVQSAFSLAVGVATLWLWLRPVDFDLKASALCSAALLATPYVLDYDMVLLGPAIAFLARHGLKNGFARYEVTILAAAWVVPLAARSIAALTFVPVGLMATALLFAAAVARGTDAVKTQRIPSTVS